ncbi:COX assembly mitochondrial protein 2 homolog [Tubulanus polymorphus]|uniref:COX assembly mitochondrial protein 2 homolog n=1 Tax=Tubulanus polymorphus TaxID=672921 RepID=UPI003DA28D6F
MHSDLSGHLHTEECNSFIQALKQCHKDNPWKKFVGVCNELDKEVGRCLRKERESKRLLNKEKSRQMQEKARRHVNLDDDDL